MWRLCGDDGELCSRCQEVALLRRELDRLRALLRRELDRLRAANARLQAWHDAVMGQEFWYWEAADESFNVIERPQPLAKE